MVGNSKKGGEKRESSQDRNQNKKKPRSGDSDSEEADNPDSETGSGKKQRGVPNPSIIVGKKRANSKSSSTFLMYGFFQECDVPKKIMCSTCGILVGYSTFTTSSMKYHLKTFHKELNEKHEALSKDPENRAGNQLKLGGGQMKLFSKDGKLEIQKKKIDPKVQATYAEGVAQYLAESFVSFSQVEKMTTIFKSIWPNPMNFKIKPLSRYEATTAVELLSKKTKNGILNVIPNLMDNVKAVCFTTDIWTSPTSEPFITLTIHIMDRNFEITKLVPFVEEFQGRHSGKNITIKLDKLLKCLNLYNNEVDKTLLLDGASNNKLSMKLSTEFTGIFCCIHRLMRAIIQAMKVAGNQQVLEKATKLVKKIRKSPIAKDALREACRGAKVSFKVPTLPVVTRWNSLYSCIASLRELQQGLRYLEVNTPKRELKEVWNGMLLNSDDWDFLESYESVLKTPFEITKAWETDHRSSSHLVIPKIFDLIQEMERWQKNEDLFISNFSKSLKAAIEERFPNYGSEDLPFAAAHYLDPYLKGIALRGIDRFQATKEWIELRNNKYEEEAAGNQLNAAEVVEAEDISVPVLSPIEQLAAKMNKTEKPESAIKHEMKQFEEEHVEGKPDIQSWWAEHSGKYPKLAKIAREVLAIPASSSSSERVFSVTGSIVSKRRHRLSNKHIEDLAIINLNYSKLEEIRDKFKVALEEESKVELKRCKLVADFVPTAMRMEDLWLSGVEYQNEEEEEEEEENGVKENSDSDSDDSIF